MSKHSEITPEDIRELRKKERLTQEDLARALNVSVNTVSRWETGESTVTGTAAAIIGALIGGATGVAVARLAGLAIAGPLGWAVGGLGSAYTVYQLLKRRFEADDERDKRITEEQRFRAETARLKKQLAEREEQLQDLEDRYNRLSEQHLDDQKKGGQDK
jgi:transcriptional regulator with XRE-family HTH domain